MAKSGTPLGIGLAIDFSQLDAELSKVADRIEKTGKEASLKVGSLAGLASKGGGGGVEQSAQLAAQVSQVGMALSRGMASGVRTSSALMLSFGARINAMLDKIAGVTVTTFSRIDAAIKGTRWQNLATGLSMTLLNFAKGSPKHLTALDKALGGAFGAIAKKIASIFDALFDKLGVTMTTAMTKATKDIAEAMIKPSQTMTASMKGSLDSIDVTVKRLAGNMSMNMGASIDAIAAKFKAMHEAAAGGLRGGGPGRPYLRELVPPSRGGRIEDIAEKIKPPSAAAMKRLAESVNMGVFGAGELAKPAPKQTEFTGRVPKPQMFKEFQSIIKDTITYIKQIPTAFDAAVASGNKAAIVAVGMGKGFLFVGQATKDVVVGIAQVAAGIVGLGLKTAAAIGRTIVFFQTLGNVGKTSYREIYERHNIFAAAVLSSVKTVRLLARGLFDLVTLNAFRRVGDDAKKFGGAVSNANSMMGKLVSSVGRLGVEIAAAFGVAGLVYKLVGFFVQGTKAASDLNTEVERSKMVFGDTFGPAAEQAEKYSKAAGVSRQSTLELQNTIGTMTQGMGVSEKTSAEMATRLTGLAANMTALGIPFEEGSEAIKTGLSGRAISLKQFGVAIDEDTTKAFAWKNGIAQAGAELTKNQTIQARAGMIMQGLSYAQGALERGTNLASVQFARAGGSMQLFAERIGELLLPAVQEGAQGFTQLMGAILDATEGSIKTLTSWGQTIKEIFSALGIAVRNAGDLWKIAQLHVNDFVVNTIAYIGTIPENAQRIWNWLSNNWSNLLVDMWNLVKTFVSNVVGYFKQLGQAIWTYLQGGEFEFDWSSIAKGFEATTEKLPELIKPAIVSSQGEIDKLYTHIGEQEQKLKDQAVKGPAAKKPIVPGEEKGKEKEYKLGGALEAGTKEAFSAISRGATGQATNKQLGVAQNSLEVQRQTLQVHKENNQILKGQWIKPGFQAK